MRTRRVIASAAILTAAVVLAVPVEAKSKNDDVSAVVKGNNEFAFDLYGQLRHKDGNVFFAPGSVSTALAMTYGGARGDTADEMAKTLHFTLPPDKLHPAYADLLRQWNTSSKCGPELSAGNALWVNEFVQHRKGIKADFLKLTQDNYGAETRSMNLAANAEAARKEINIWAAKQTHDQIKAIAPDFNDYTALILTSAVYFKGNWDNRFPRDQTRDEEFSIGRDRIEVPMMHQTGKFNYLNTDKMQVLEMPYAGKDLSMVVVLPKTADGLTELEKSLTSRRLACWLTGLSEEKVSVSLPRFRTTAEYHLKETLQALGMKQAFSAGDFSGIEDNATMWIGDVYSKAVVDVNEDGTVAAGVSAVVLDKEFVPSFRADHPFVFLIRDTRNDSILFLGRIVNPMK